MQLSSISLPTNRLWTLSHSKSKNKSNRCLSSSAFSHSFPPNQTRHHECLPQGRESSCVHINAPFQQVPVSRRISRSSATSISSITTLIPRSQASTNQPKPLFYPSILPYMRLPIDVAEQRCPTLYIIRRFASYFLFLSRPPLLFLTRFRPSFCTPSQALVRPSLAKQSLHVLICPIVQYTTI